MEADDSDGDTKTSRLVLRLAGSHRKPAAAGDARGLFVQVLFQNSLCVGFGLFPITTLRVAQVDLAPVILLKMPVCFLGDGPEGGKRIARTPHSEDQFPTPAAAVMRKSAFSFFVCR